ncbi:hypothetical protein [Magnetospirillum sulfuroxidans]|uniref:Lipoprotein n=1 Tax=Magnetospirillum sulfuroxidans TaxID=611300 RepID=A0ABS5IEW2_9PROT|nr:hypothetical protein [Magnetospirillum sulfuroxidans]MBR9972308.1 hypothetical protein [Magnetospirillum sulfuroxidans]
MKRRMLLLAMMTAPLAACGRKSRPLPPEGATYPRQYPNVDFPEDKNAGKPKSETENP